MIEEDAYSVERSGTGLSTREVERTVCELWSGLFGTPVSPHDDFFDLGGDSLSIIDMVMLARQRGLPVRSSVALRNPTPARLAESLTVRNGALPSEPDGDTTLPTVLASPRTVADDRSWPRTCSRSAASQPEPTLEPIVADGTAPPLFVLHSHCHVQAERAAVRTWTGGRSALGLRAPGARGPVPTGYTIADTAGRYLVSLRREQPTGPYHLVGFDHSAVVAFELARALRRHGHAVHLLAMVKPPGVSDPGRPVPGYDQLLQHRLTLLARRFGLTGAEGTDEILARMRQAGWYDDGVLPTDLPRLQQAWTELALAVRRYRPDPFDGAVVVFQDVEDARDTADSWEQVIAEPQVHWLDYGLESPLPMIGDPRLAEVMGAELAR